MIAPDSYRTVNGKVAPELRATNASARSRQHGFPARELRPTISATPSARDACSSTVTDAAYGGSVWASLSQTSPAPPASPPTHPQVPVWHPFFTPMINRANRIGFELPSACASQARPEIANGRCPKRARTHAEAGIPTHCFVVLPESNCPSSRRLLLGLYAFGPVAFLLHVYEADRDLLALKIAQLGLAAT